MTTYCTEDDLEAYRPNILQLGVSDWEFQLTEAGAIIDRTLEVQWYRQACRDLVSNSGLTHGSLDWREYPFNPELLLNKDTNLTRLGVFKTLQLAYLHMAKDAPPTEDAFASQAETYNKLYVDELKAVLARGLDYDWDESGALDYSETRIPRKRRLGRC